mgnify:CR=1 FL=1|tara:strand:+ start:149 stop:949 length:801 start_codon:yes stop_codon:yes gene_type:complete
MKPYLFLHIPKTGGSSVEQCLPFGRCTFEDVFKDSKNNSDFDIHAYSAARYHYTIEQLKNVNLCDDKRLNQLYKFTFVRNPWDRVVSIFHDWRVQNCRKNSYKNILTGETYLEQEEFGDDIFSQFVSNVLTPVFDTRIKNYSPKINFNDGSEFLYTQGAYSQPVKKCPFYYTIANGHFVPQIKYTHNSSGDQIVDFVGKFETLQEDFDKLNNICGWNFKFMILPHVNKSKRAQKNYRKYYDDGSGLAKHLVSELYREDIETYGYTF